MDIQDTVCSDLKAYSAACFLLEVTNVQVIYNLNNCSIESTTSQTMGAVVLSNVNAQITGSRFINNSAIQSISSGDGGGLYLSPCSQATGCQVNISNSQFTNNTASHQGGAIAWTDYQPVLTNVSFAGNSAPYGTDIASYAIKLASLTSRRLFQLSGVPSGQIAPESVTVAQFDHYDQIVTIDNSSLATLFSASCITSVSGVTQVIAEQGVFLFSAYEVISTPGNTTEIMVHTSGIDNSKPLNNGTISPELVISVQMRNCTIGESQMDMMCYICPAGKYSLDPSKACQDCPIGAICLGNFTMIPQPGYWRSNYMSTTFWACPNPRACLGSSYIEPMNISYTGNCRIGYYGNMCNGCISGYSLTSTNSCTQCPSFASSIVLIVGVTLFVLLVILFIIKMSLVSARQTAFQTSISLKIFINYIQLVGIVASLNMSWPSGISQLLDSQENAGGISELVFSYDCLADNGTINNQRHIVYEKIIIFAFLPLMIVIASLSFWIIISVISRKWSYMKYQFVNSLAVMFFIAHPSIVKVMSSVFNCQEIDSGQYWMTSYLSVQCWDSEHMKYAMIVALPSIILWGLFVPAVTLLLLVLNRKFLNELSLRIQLGFLFTGYQDDKCFWEFVILYRKVVFITFSVFLTSVSIPVQALCSMLVLFAAFLLQVKYNPYSTAMLNNLELRAILAAGVTIYCGLFYLTAELSNDAKDVLFAIIVSANAYFVIYFLFYQCKALCQLLGKLIKRQPHPHYNVSVHPEENSQAMSRRYSNSEIQLFGNVLSVQKQTRVDAPQNTPMDSLVIT